jgi:hypothetical protein
MTTFGLASLAHTVQACCSSIFTEQQACGRSGFSKTEFLRNTVVF